MFVLNSKTGKRGYIDHGLKSTDEYKLTREVQDYFNNIKHWQEEAAFLQKQIDEDFNISRITALITDIYSELTKKRLQS